MPLSTTHLEIRFGSDTLTLVKYPFMRHNKGRVIGPPDISDVVVGWHPPCIRVKGEYLFVPEADLDRLIDFAKSNCIPFKRRVDIWSMILDPFLDTEFDDDYWVRNRRMLMNNGIDDVEVEEMRKLVGTRMLLLMHYTWEWCYLGLFDVLEQMRHFTFTTGWAFDRFYDYAQALADRGEAVDSSPGELRQGLQSVVDPF